MNTERLYYGDINEIKTVIKKYNYELFEGEEVIATIPLEESYRVVKPYKRKAILVKYGYNNYVELAKLKTLKDFINVYFELFFEPENYKYIIKKDFITNNRYLIPYSIKKYEGNLKPNESIKTLRKILLDEKNNR